MRTNIYQTENSPYGTTQFVTMKESTTYGVGPNAGPSSGSRYVSSSNNLRNSKVTRKTVYGEKYDYGEKVKEKRNYLLYVSGTLREKKEIEEIEQLQPEPKYLEEKEIIDNYQYHESKNLRKQNPNRLSITQHKRLSSPFEKTTIRAVTDDGSPFQYATRTTTSTKQRLCSVPKRSNVQYEKLETYQPQKKYGYQRRYDYTPVTRKTEVLQQRRTKVPLGEYETNVNEYYQYQPQNEVYELRSGNKDTNTYNLGKYKLNEGETKTETRQDGDYFIKTTITKKTLDNPNYNTVDVNKLRNLRNRSERGDNYNYYESKNVRKVGRLNRPVTYHSRRGESEERNYSYNNNLRNVRNYYQSSQSNTYGRPGGYQESRTFEQRRTRRFGGVGNDDQFGYLRNQGTCTGKYETYEEVDCPIHGRQTIRREYVY